MNWLKNISISFIISIILILLLTFFLAVFSYFDIINNGLFVFSQIIILAISIFIGGFLIGKKSKKRGWLEGIKFGLIFVVFLLLINYFGYSIGISLKFILYNFIVLVVSMFGGMVGISFRKEKK